MTMKISVGLVSKMDPYLNWLNPELPVIEEGVDEGQPGAAVREPAGNTPVEEMSIPPEQDPRVIIGNISKAAVSELWQELSQEVPRRIKFCHDAFRRLTAVGKERQKRIK